MSDLKRNLSLKLLLGGLSGAIAGLAVAGPAQAQFFGAWGYMPYQYRMLPEIDGGPVYMPRRFRPMMSPGDIRMSLSEEGYQVVGGLQINGRVYIANVRDRRGQGFRIVVDGIDGNVLQRFARATPARPPEALARGSMGGEDYFDPPRLPSPSVTPQRHGPRAEPTPRRAPPAASARREPAAKTEPARTVVRPDGSSVATRPPQERVTKIAPDDSRSVVTPTVASPGPEAAKPEVAKPEVAKPEVAKPELMKPAEAKPEAVKPAAPVAQAVRQPRVVYPDAAQTKAPVETMPAPPSDGTGLKPTPPLSSVPVAPLE
ncbi:hypothetical protein PY365_00820 [Roseiarcaceae bacterium H3SJ34-1]|uniref:hypothetical protein n=1 Tax=Terripilifer ovatus TaxID=3032367 RepID=UPI003AB937EB|nr:hypothetical protein [Roseiarcaceae bacterium H3SJ34-1]